MNKLIDLFGQHGGIVEPKTSQNVFKGKRHPSDSYFAYITRSKWNAINGQVTDIDHKKLN